MLFPCVSGRCRRTTVTTATLVITAALSGLSWTHRGFNVMKRAMPRRLPSSVLASLAGLSALCLVSIGCKRKEAAPVNADLVQVDGGGTMSVVRFGGLDDDAPHLDFVIDAMHLDQKPSAAVPWHERGGTWTFFDAHFSGGERFGFGLQGDDEASSSGQFSFAKAMITVPDANAGAALVPLFAKAFGGKSPPALAREPLKIEPVPVAILGRNVEHASSGYAGKGHWTTTKLFLQRAGLEAEVFFNFDPDSRRGVFSEKDHDYADALVALLAMDLRDGPRRARTTESDPQLSAVGPKFDSWRAFGAPKAAFYRFEPASRGLLFTLPEGTNTRLMQAPLDNPTNSTEVIRVEHRFDHFSCASAAPDLCVLSEVHPKSANILASDDPRGFFLVNRKSKTKSPLQGEWGPKAGTAGSPISPDGAFIALSAWKPKSKGMGNVRIAYLVPTSEGAAIVVEVKDEPLDVIGWTGTGRTLRAVVQNGLSIDKQAKRSWMSVDPRTGERSVLASPPAGMVKDEALSPDGKRRVTCKAHEEIVVTTLATKATSRFIVHPDDRASLTEDCVSWAGSRFLQFGAARTGFIDIETMKLSYPFPEGEDVTPLDPNDDFTWAVSTAPEGLRVARIVVR